MKFTKEQKQEIIDCVLYSLENFLDKGVVFPHALEDAERILRLELNKRERVRKNMPRVAIP